MMYQLSRKRSLLSFMFGMETLFKVRASSDEREILVRNRLGVPFQEIGWEKESLNVFLRVFLLKGTTLIYRSMNVITAKLQASHLPKMRSAEILYKIHI